MLERRIAKLQAGYSNAAWTMESLFTPDALTGSLTSAQCVDKMIEVMHEYDALTTSPQTKGNTKPLGGDALLDGLFYLNVSSNGNMTASLGDLHMQKQRQDALFASATVVGVAAIHAYGSDPGVAKGNPDAGVGKVTSQDYAAGGFKTGNTQGMNTVVVEGAWNVADDVAKGASSMRDNLLNLAQNDKLKNAINEIYRPGATTGDGGLADAVRHELSTGELVGGKSHILKAMERVTNLENIINKQPLNQADLDIATNILNDLNKALGGN